MATATNLARPLADPSPQYRTAPHNIEAEQALDWGLVNRVAPPDQVMEVARELARSLLAKPAESLAMGKALLYRQLEQGLAQAYDDAPCTNAANMDTDVAREGVDAFLAKRAPNWKR